MNERCGLILKDGTVVEITNIADDPALGFKMDPKEAIKHIDDAVGSWHTHVDTDPNLSGEDYSGFLAWPALEHHIIGRRDGEVVVVKYRVENGLVVACD